MKTTAKLKPWPGTLSVKQSPTFLNGLTLILTLRTLSVREIGKKHCKSSVTYFLLNKKPPVKQVVFLFTLSKPAGLDSVNCPMQ